MAFAISIWLWRAYPDCVETPHGLAHERTPLQVNLRHLAGFPRVTTCVIDELGQDQIATIWSTIDS